jgi:hypothetical protein
MRQPIRMEVRLLNAGAYEKKEGAHDGKQKMPAHVGRTMLCHFSHLHPRLYATSAAILSGRCGCNSCDMCDITTVAGLGDLDSAGARR